MVIVTVIAFFSTNQTLKNHLHDFKPDDFDYLIIDEAHHVSAATYQTIVGYFEPKFTLGNDGHS